MTPAIDPLTKYLTLPIMPLNDSQGFSKFSKVNLQDFGEVKEPAGSSSLERRVKSVDRDALLKISAQQMGSTEMANELDTEAEVIDFAWDCQIDYAGQTVVLAIHGQLVQGVLGVDVSPEFWLWVRVQDNVDCWFGFQAQHREEFVLHQTSPQHIQLMWMSILPIINAYLQVSLLNLQKNKNLMSNYPQHVGALSHQLHQLQSQYDLLKNTDNYEKLGSLRLTIKQLSEKLHTMKYNYVQGTQLMELDALRQQHKEDQQDLRNHYEKLIVKEESQLNRTINDIDHDLDRGKAELVRNLEQSLNVGLTPDEYPAHIKQLEAKQNEYKSRNDFVNAQKYKAKKLEELKKEQQKLQKQKAIQIELELKEIDKKHNRKIAEMKKEFEKKVKQLQSKLQTETKSLLKKQQIVANEYRYRFKVELENLH